MDDRVTLLRRSFDRPLDDSRVALRRPEDRDIATIARYLTRDDAQAWLSGAGDAGVLYREYLAGWQDPGMPNRLGLTLVITETAHNDLVGVVHLDPHADALGISYGVAPDFRGRGIASRAVSLVTVRAFTEGFRRVELEIGENNNSSQGVARRCGFTRTSRTRSQITDDGSVWRARYWTLDGVEARPAP